ncbi:MAG: hypothetical protein RL757_2377 [Bacteroidota bacterium]|jgi:7-keto-8-aminopelargonate synthetase-like enzyme
MKKINHLPSRVLEIDGVEKLFFSGTAYFGMGHQTAFRTALLEGLARYGTVFSVSRNNNLQLDVYDEAENWLQKSCGSEAALTVSSGMLAGQILLKTYLSNVPDSNFIVFPKTHPALWRKMPPPQYPSPKFNNFAKKTVEMLENIPSSQHFALLFNSVDPLFCEPHDFDWIEKLPKRHKISLICDDSHGFGLWQSNGNCLFDVLQKKLISEQHEVIVSTSMGKALGVSGGLILGSQMVIDSVRRSGWFGGASPIPPAMLFAFLEIKNIYPQYLTDLQKNIHLFKSKINTSLLFDELPNFPVFHVKDHSLYDFLYERNIFISNFPYPTADAAPLSRVILSALHTDEDINYLANCLKQFS